MRAQQLRGEGGRIAASRPTWCKQIRSGHTITKEPVCTHVTRVYTCMHFVNIVTRGWEGTRQGSGAAQNEGELDLQHSHQGQA